MSSSAAIQMASRFSEQYSRQRRHTRGHRSSSLLQLSSATLQTNCRQYCKLHSRATEQTYQQHRRLQCHLLTVTVFCIICKMSFKTPKTRSLIERHSQSVTGSWLSAYCLLAIASVACDQACDKATVG